MDIKQEINLKAFIFTLPHSFIAALTEALEKIHLKTAIRVTLVQEVGRHNDYRRNTAFCKAQNVTDITFQHTYNPFLMFKLILQKLKVY